MHGSNITIRRATHRGFTLLIAVVLASVATAIGIALASISYKSVRLSGTTQASQSAFYTSDSALECTLYADQQMDTFDYATHDATPTMTCVNGSVSTTISFTPSQWDSTTLQFVSQSPAGYTNGWFPINGYCARVTAYKTTSSHTYLYSEGVSNCNLADPRTLERGVDAYY